MDTARDPHLPRLAGRLSVTFILALKFLASPGTARTRQPARRGRHGARRRLDLLHRPSGMLANWWILAGRRRRSARWSASLGARRVPMTAMPQMVAIFNGAGGGAAALVAVAEFLRDAERQSRASSCRWHSSSPRCSARSSAPSSLTGSIVAFGKLQGLIASRPVKYPGSQIVTAVLFLALVGARRLPRRRRANSVPLFLVFVGLALVLGRRSW